MSNVQKQSAASSSSGNNGNGDKVVLAAFGAFTGSAAGMAGILTADGIHIAATIVALAIFGVLGIGALLVAGIYLRRR